MSIKDMMCTKNSCFKSSIKIKPKYIIIHSIGTPQPDPKKVIEYWDMPGTEQIAHAIVDDSGNSFQCLPWDVKGWHVGPLGNATTIGIEMTEPSWIQYTGGASFKDPYPQKTRDFCGRCYKTAAKLAAELCHKYGISPDNVISHSEAHKKGIASNHSDPEHIWGRNYTMDAFRSEVKAELRKLEEPEKPASKKLYEYREDVSGNYATTTELNLRSGAGVSNPVIKVLPKGTLCGYYGRYSLVGSSKWVYVLAKLKTGSIRGFVNASYLKKMKEEMTCSLK